MFKEICLRPPYYTNELGHQIAGSPEATAEAQQRGQHEREKRWCEEFQRQQSRVITQKQRGRLDR